MNATHEALINHASVKGVTCCHPMSGRYCAIGRERLNSAAPIGVRWNDVLAVFD